jgi:anthranilate phosphoribosyltransferase
VSRFKDGSVDNFFIEPEDFGIWRNPVKLIQGGNKEENAVITLAILNGEEGPRREIILMNSAIAFVAAGKTEDFKVAFSMASDSLDSGRALKKLEEVKRVSNSL